MRNYLIAGPVIRYNRINFLKLDPWKTFDSFGGGGFMELRFAKFLFAGLEVSVNKSPFTKGSTFFTLEEKSWAASAFVSGGFSYEI